MAGKELARGRGRPALGASPRGRTWAAGVLEAWPRSSQRRGHLGVTQSKTPPREGGIWGGSP